MCLRKEEKIKYFLMYNNRDLKKYVCISLQAENVCRDEISDFETFNQTNQIDLQNFGKLIILYSTMFSF